MSNDSISTFVGELIINRLPLIFFLLFMKNVQIRGIIITFFKMTVWLLYGITLILWLFAGLIAWLFSLFGNTIFLLISGWLAMFGIYCIYFSLKQNMNEGIRINIQWGGLCMIMAFLSFIIHFRIQVNWILFVHGVVCFMVMIWRIFRSMHR